MNQPVVSVVIPVYNVAPFLVRAVKSVQVQTWNCMEILLVDNGSTDGSSELVDQLAAADPRIVPLHVEKKGVSFARLEGVKAASGEWIGFVDGDDWIEPDMYARLLKNALQSNARISHCGYQMVFPSRVDYYYNTGRLVLQDNLAGLKDLIEGAFVEPGLCNKLFHKSLFRQLLAPNGFDFHIRINEDLLMNYYLFKGSTRSVFEDFCPYHYMVRKNSTATSTLNEHALRDPIRVKKMIRDDCGEEGLRRIAEEKLLDRLITDASRDWHANPELIKPHVKQTRKELRTDLFHYLKLSISFQRKARAIWAATWPASYRWVHTAYSKLRGSDKKYEVS